MHAHVYTYTHAVYMYMTQTNNFKDNRQEDDQGTFPSAAAW